MLIKFLRIDGLKILAAGAFESCASFEGIGLPQTLSKIDGNVFACCSPFKSIQIDDDNKIYESPGGHIV